MAYADLLIAAQELKRHLGDSRWRIVDCRFDLLQPEKGYADYLAGHIPGAAYAHLDRDLAGPVTRETGRHPLPHPEVMNETLGKWGISSNSRVVVYDGGGGAIAARLWWLLRWLGHRSVVLLDGGFDAWCRAGLDIETSLPEITPATYVGKPDPLAIVTTDELQQAMESAPLVDARAHARFAGHSEPIDKVAGHIPQAQNFPFTESLNADGTWKNEDELASAWTETLGGDRNRAWITMCGSGVTACHLAISAQVAGFRAPRLYVGSWSEWIRDPERPIATER